MRIPRLASLAMLLALPSLTLAADIGKPTPPPPQQAAPDDAARARATTRAMNKEKLLARHRGDEAAKPSDASPTPLVSALDAPIFHRYDRP